jgi:hypothetical protein
MMLDHSQSGTDRPDDEIQFEANGRWIDGVYVGFVPEAGHVIKTDKTLVVIPQEHRLRQRH